MELNKPKPIVIPSGRIIEYALDWKQADTLIHELIYGVETLEHAIDENYYRGLNSYIVLRSVSFPEEIQSSVDKRIIVPGCSIQFTGFLWDKQ
jgi:hypothetical protein